MDHLAEQRGMFEQPLADEAIIAIIANDIPGMDEAQLAELLTNLVSGGPGVVASALVPMAQDELRRRRAQVERVSATT